MAIVKMKRLRVVAMQADRSELLQKLQRLGCVEIRQPDIDQPDFPSLSTPDSKALTQAKNQHQAGKLALEILGGYSKPTGGMLAPRPVISEKDLFQESERNKGWDTIQQITTAKQDIANFLAEQTALQGQKDMLAPWVSLELPLETESTKNVTVQFGTLPKEVDLTTVKADLNRATDLAELSLAETRPEAQYLLLTCYTPVAEEAMAVLKAAGWSRTNFRNLVGTAQENFRRMEQELTEVAKKISAKEENLARMGEHRALIQRYLDGTQQIIAREEAASHLLDTDSAFYLEGWVEADKWAGVEQLLSQYTTGWEVEEPKEEEIPEVPVKLKNGKISRSLSVVTEMYSLPAYNGVDPNPLMAPFFIFFYGMMMADMGYGLLMIIATQYVLSKAKPGAGGMRDFCELFRMLGYSTFAWGAITGGFFGNFVEALLKTFNPDSNFVWFWEPLFTPLDDTISVLYASIAFGAVHVLTGMIVSFCKKAKDGRMMDGIMDEGSWWLLFAGIGVGVLTANWLVAYAGVAALVLTQGRKNSGVMRVVGGVASLYDITGYFGDLLSYARLMALMLAGSVIAKVFNDLGVITGNAFAFLLISLAGNTLNFLLNLLGCFVHTLRLQCLEFFGKFYMDGGRAFKPLNNDTTYVDIQGQNS